jgi:PKHD-type hydroxylase
LEIFMLLQIAGLLPAEKVKEIGASLVADGASFVSGKATAGAQARLVKNNDQSAGPAARAAIASVSEALMANAVFKAAARPREIFGMLVSRYRSGMAYGAHVDDALMGGKRTDLSFTFFVSELASYDGGELVIEGNDGENAIKLAAGSVVVYPTTSLHRVAEVTRGERLVVVGWVRSFIRSGEQREILFDLDQIVAQLVGANADRPITDRVLKTRNNLMRLWAED